MFNVGDIELRYSLYHNVFARQRNATSCGCMNAIMQDYKRGEYYALEGIIIYLRFFQNKQFNFMNEAKSPERNNMTNTSTNIARMSPEWNVVRKNNDSIAEKVLWSAKDLMGAGLSRSKAYELLNRADMPVVRLGDRVYMLKDKFLAWLDAQATNCANSVSSDD